MVPGAMSDRVSIPLPAKPNTTEANTPSMLVVNPQAQSLLEARHVSQNSCVFPALTSAPRCNIRKKSKRSSMPLSICQDKLYSESS